MDKQNPMSHMAGSVSKKRLIWGSLLALLVLLFVLTAMRRPIVVWYHFSRMEHAYSSMYKEIEESGGMQFRELDEEAYDSYCDHRDRLIDM